MISTEIELLLSTFRIYLKKPLHTYLSTILPKSGPAKAQSSSKTFVSDIGLTNPRFFIIVFRHLKPTCNVVNFNLI